MRRRHTFHSALLGALFGLWLVPTVGLAQPADADRATARALGQEGYDALDRNDHATAADRFARADALVHAPTFVVGLARAQVGLGKLVSALEAYNRIVHEGVAPRAPAAFVRALEDARKELDALGPRIPYVIIQVTGAPAAKVSIDGADVPAAALGVKRAVDPGRHTLRASADGFPAREIVVTIAEGRSDAVTLDLKPPGPAPIVTQGPRALAPAGSSGPLPAPSGSGSARRALGIAGLAAGGAGIGLGAVMGGLVIAKHGDLVKSCPGGACPTAQQGTLGRQLDTYHFYSAVSTAGFIAGGVLAGAGVVLLATAPKPTLAVGNVTFDPMIGLGWAGARGRF